MQFRTELNPGPAPFQLSHEDSILSIGSCFADSMGQRFADHRFPILLNPFGVIYNPISLFGLLGRSLKEDPSLYENLHFHNERWFSYDLHSDLAFSDREEAAAAIRMAMQETALFLRNAKVLILTLGTSRVWRRKENGEIVANCHKKPAFHFERHWLSPDKILLHFQSLRSQIAELNPDLQILLTVSPVRHAGEGLEANSVSKAALRYFCHLAAESDPQTQYFPAFELLNDDLRDYRFYGADLVHPNAQAEFYIWTKFVESYCGEETRSLMEKWEKLQKGLSHRPFNPDSEAHRSFRAKLKIDWEALAEKLDLGEFGSEPV